MLKINNDKLTLYNKEKLRQLTCSEASLSKQSIPGAKFLKNQNQLLSMIYAINMDTMTAP